MRDMNKTQTPAVEHENAMDAPLLAVRQMGKSFGSHQVLFDIDFTVNKGDVISIIGPSGSGKSTLLRCMNRLEDPTTGSIRFEGHDYANKRELPRLRSEVGMVFQHFNMFPHMTALGNVIEGPTIVKRMNKSDAVAMGKRLLERVGLGDRVDHYPSQLSGGQKQRVAIARALAMEPKLMLFDEVTSALDPELVGEVLKTLRDLASGGMTMVLVTHEMGFAEEIGSRVVFMDAGRIVEDSEPKRFFRNPESDRARAFLKAVINRAPMEDPADGDANEGES